MGEMAGDKTQDTNDTGIEMTGQQGAPEKAAVADINVNTPDDSKGVKTDVDGVYADGEKTGVPVFDVSAKEFYDNMKSTRRRLRFKSGSAAQQYHSKSKYRRPFYIRNKDDGYMRIYK
jgi:hypothetical protein